MADQDSELFQQAMQGVTPLVDSKKAALQSRPHKPTLQQQAHRQAAVAGEDELTLGQIELVPPFDPIDFKRDGVQEGVDRYLRLGKYQADARLELQGKTPQQARDELPDFLDQCVKFGIRTVLIHHGRGKHPQARGNLLKSYLNVWLPRLPEVMAFHSAQKQHGGLGAVYVLLVKSEQERLDNKEKHLKRRR